MTGCCADGARCHPWVDVGGAWAARIRCVAQAYFISATDRHYLTSDYGSTTKLLKTPVYLDAALGMHALQPHPKHLEWLLVVGRKISCAQQSVCPLLAYTSTDGGATWSALASDVTKCMWAWRHGLTRKHESTILCQGVRETTSARTGARQGLGWVLTAEAMTAGSDGGRRSMQRRPRVLASAPRSPPMARSCRGSCGCASPCR